MENILITGANGHLASIIKKQLSSKYNILFLSTNKKSTNNDNIFYWNIKKNIIDDNVLNNVHHIIHLAGTSILKPWTKKNKEEMYESRVKGSELIFNKCKSLNIKPKTFISASAIGIYGLKSSGIKNEDSELGNDWVAKMAIDWEKASNNFNELGTRVVQMRISLLVSKEAGFLKYNLMSMKFGLGAIIGSKNNPVNWIHSQDVSKFIDLTLKNEEINGPYNLANPNFINQKDFMRKIKNIKYKYAIILNIPIWLPRLIIGDRSSIINSKFTVSVDKLNQLGFKWDFQNIEQILD
ncbi:MAG: TIGR01777 family protein [Flavobacteriales bacterium]|nr:TIGR01777 family protein [Flavobacteriales bacterium]|tara:strand:- start:511 stop:1395 length:885 start_codon:yes stop_codon:yes gene_type:complete